MKITPERAKALSGIVREYGIHNLTSHEEVEIAAIVHHYAEILQKWQAVLDAEPVMWMGLYHQTITNQVKLESGDLYPDFCAPLIIKPAP